MQQNKTSVQKIEVKPIQNNDSNAPTTSEKNKNSASVQKQKTNRATIITFSIISSIVFLAALALALVFTLATPSKSYLNFK